MGAAIALKHSKYVTNKKLRILIKAKTRVVIKKSQILIKIVIQYIEESQNQDKTSYILIASPY